MANPFSVQVVNPLQALLLGQQSYASGIESNRKQAQDAARADAAALYQAGDTRGALARLLSGGDLQGAGTYSTLDNAAYQRTRDTINDARADKRDAFSQYIQSENLKLSRRSADRADDNTPKGFQPNPAGGLSPIPGGPADPAYLDQVEKARQRNDFLRAVEERKVAAATLGLTPEHPAYNAFILTNKMPREDAQPLTATDKKAILEADEMVLTNQNAIDALQQAKNLSPKAFSGPTAGARGYASSFLGESSDFGKAGIATQDLNNLVTSNALGQLKSIFGAAPTEGERKILMDIQGSVNQPDSVRQKIYDRAIELASKRLEFNRKKAEELRGNQYYKPHGTSRTSSVQAQGITQAQYEALPSGTVFTAPDGTQRVKP